MSDIKSLTRNLPKLYDSTRRYFLDEARIRGLLHGQPRILDFLSRNDGCKQKDFCDEYSLEAPTVSNMLAIMEKDGLLVRKRNPDSSRVVNVFITDKGKEIQDRLEPVYEEAEKIAFAGFTEEEHSLFLQLFSRVTENMMAYRSEKK